MTTERSFRLTKTNWNSFSSITWSSSKPVCHGIEMKSSGVSVCFVSINYRFRCWFSIWHGNSFICVLLSLLFKVSENGNSNDKCWILMIQWNKKTSHRNRHYQNNVKLNFIWLYRLFVLLLIHFLHFHFLSYSACVIRLIICWTNAG